MTTPPQPSLKGQAALWFQLGVYCELGLLVVTLVVAWFANLRPLDWIAGGAGDIAFGFVVTLPLLGLFLLVLKSRLAPFARMREIMDGVLLPVARNWSVWQVAVLSALAGICEEIAFRGMLMDIVTDWSGPGWALFASAAVFGICHMITPGYAVFAGFIGLIFGVMYLATGNLIAPIVAHALYDFIALLWWTRRSGGPSA